jgi:aspartate ammonia-lyase
MEIGPQTSKSVIHFSFSGRKLGDYPKYISSLLDVKEAAARANCSNGHISREEGENLAEVIRSFRSEIFGLNSSHLREIYPVDMLGGGGSIGVHMNISELISTRSGLPLSVINCSQSTADVCHTASRIAIIKSWQGLEEISLEIVQTLEDQAKAFQPIETLARTCLQDAVAVSLGESWSAYAAAIKRRLFSLQQRVEDLHQINLGGTVIGSGEGASIGYRGQIASILSQVTGFPLRLRNNLYDAAQNSDDLGIFSSELSQLALALMKLARDLRLLSSGPRGGMGEIRLPQLQEGSSFFSNKVNPVMPETLLQCCFQVLGADRAIQAALEHAELNLNVFEGAILVNILDSMQGITRCLQLFHLYGLQDIQVVSSRCEELSRFRKLLKSEE